MTLTGTTSTLWPWSRGGSMSAHIWRSASASTCSERTMSMVASTMQCTILPLRVTSPTQPKASWPLDFRACTSPESAPRLQQRLRRPPIRTVSSTKHRPRPRWVPRPLSSPHWVPGLAHPDGLLPWPQISETGRLTKTLRHGELSFTDSDPFSPVPH